METGNKYFNLLITDGYHKVENSGKIGITCHLYTYHLVELQEAVSIAPNYRFIKGNRIIQSDLAKTACVILSQQSKVSKLVTASQGQAIISLAHPGNDVIRPYCEL
jgi:hypothetical protein